MPTCGMATLYRGRVCSWNTEGGGFVPCSHCQCLTGISGTSAPRSPNAASLREKRKVMRDVKDKRMATFQNRMVYIIDDDAAVRDSTAALLKSAGFVIRSYASGRAFLKDFPSTAAGCILLDLHMPDISGFKMLDILRARGNRAPIVLFSGRTDPETEEFARSSGAVAILAKPVDDNHLVEVIQKLLANRDVALVAA
jgi:two-component system response regulator FixJ